MPQPQHPQKAQYPLIRVIVRTVNHTNKDTNSDGTGRSSNSSRRRRRRRRRRRGGGGGGGGGGGRSSSSSSSSSSI